MQSQLVETSEIAEFSLCQGARHVTGAKDTLEQDGVICIRNAIPSAWLSTVESGIDAALTGASTDVDIVKRSEDKGSFSVSSGAWREVDQFRQYIFESPVVDIAWSLLDTKQLVLFYDFLLVKDPESNNAATPWHQDHSYYPLDGAKLINCWTALDHIPLESALRFAKGSHQSQTLYRAVDFVNPDEAYRHVRPELPLPPGDDDSPFDIVTTELNPGDMLVWKSYTLHAAPGNKLNRRRAAFSVNWLGDDVVYNDKPSLESYRDPSQKIGKPITCDKFPLVREI